MWGLKSIDSNIGLNLVHANRVGLALRETSFHQLDIPFELLLAAIFAVRQDEHLVKASLTGGDLAEILLSAHHKHITLI